MQEIVIMLLMLLGAILIFLAGVGILRMPDVFLRMSATAKAGTLGVGLILTAAALHFNEFGIYARVIAIIFFILLTAPIAAHIIGRAAYFDGVPLWEDTVQDDLKKHYRISDHALYSGELPSEEFLVPQKEADDFSEEPE
ncbi:MAG: monovalent cation/H(+) antiporter subunit G [Anaerolineae bacterium]|nr:monovalent cation/H(+) antiporter subunit G [Anaerolineae bacterium]